MANLVIKKNFVDGDKLFAQQLNNNFETIEKAINDGNKIVWQDGTEVKFKRYVTNDIDSLPVFDGSIIYDTAKGRQYIDYKGQRIQVGSAGREVIIQEAQPTEEDNKIWIDSDVVNTMGTEVVNSLEGNETNMAPSVKAVNKLNTYSTEEQRIGTWIDEKPLYRKVIVGNEISEKTQSFSHAISNLDSVVKILAIGRWEDTFYDISAAGYIINATSTGIGISKMEQGINLNGYIPTFIIEYTKTIDSEVI